MPVVFTEPIPLLMKAVVALVEVQDKIALAPEVMLLGKTVREQVGRFETLPTVIEAVHVLFPPEVETVRI